MKCGSIINISGYGVKPSPFFKYYNTLTVEITLLGIDADGYNRNMLEPMAALC